MKKIGFLITLVFYSFQGYSQEKNFIDQPYLETSAIVDTLVVPDRIYLSIIISEKDTKGKTSVEELENNMNSKLTTIGIDTKKQLFLSDASSNLKKYFLKNTDILKNKTYNLVVYNAETVGKVIIALESIDISNISLQKTTYSKLEQLKQKLKYKAVLKAKKQAESMLKPLNQKLGKAIHITDLTSTNINGLEADSNGIRFRRYNYSAEKREYKSISIDFEKIKVNSAISIKFGIE